MNLLWMDEGMEPALSRSEQVYRIGLLFCNSNVSILNNPIFTAYI